MPDQSCQGPFAVDWSCCLVAEHSLSTGAETRAPGPMFEFQELAWLRVASSKSSVVVGKADPALGDTPYKEWGSEDFRAAMSSPCLELIVSFGGLASLMRFSTLLKQCVVCSQPCTLIALPAACEPAVSQVATTSNRQLMQFW